MTQRSYNQYCPIAHALDLVGDRWALLVVRDLLLGPKRFSDLLGGLPGLGTNILTDRLKALEAAGLLRRRALPPPAPATIYELTEEGRELEGVVVALASWGGRSLGPPREGQFLSRDSLRLTARAWARGLMPALGIASLLIALEDDRLSDRMLLRSVAGSVRFAEDEGGPPDLSVALDVGTLFALAGGSLSLEEGVRRGLARLGPR